MRGAFGWALALGADSGHARARCCRWECHIRQSVQVGSRCEGRLAFTSAGRNRAETNAPSILPVELPHARRTSDIQYICAVPQRSSCRSLKGRRRTVPSAGIHASVERETDFHVGFQNLKPYKATVSGTKSGICLLLITGELSRPSACRWSLVGNLELANQDKRWGALGNDTRTQHSCRWSGSQTPMCRIARFGDLDGSISSS